jgi:RNA polymerase sigma-70 factor (ECF subfamily)
LLLPLDEDRDSIHVEQNFPQHSTIDQSDVAEGLLQTLMELAPHYRAVIELRHYQEMSYSEIAQALNLPMSDVKSHLFRARKILAERLKHDP